MDDLEGFEPTSPPVILNSPAPIIEQPPPLPPRRNSEIARTPSVVESPNSSSASSSGRRLDNFVIPRRDKVIFLFSLFLVINLLFVFYFTFL